MLLPAKVLDRFSIAENLPTDLLPYLSLNAIPTAYGGNFSLKSDLDNGCMLEKTIISADFLVSFQEFFSLKLYHLIQEGYAII